MFIFNLVHTLQHLRKVVLLAVELFAVKVFRKIHDSNRYQQIPKVLSNVLDKSGHFCHLNDFLCSQKRVHSISCYILSYSCKFLEKKKPKKCQAEQLHCGSRKLHKTDVNLTHPVFLVHMRANPATRLGKQQQCGSQCLNPVMI